MCYPCPFIAQGAFTPVSLVILQMPLFRHVGGHLGRDHHHEPTARGSHRFQDILAVPMQLADQEMCYEQCLVADLGGGEDREPL